MEMNQIEMLTNLLMKQIYTDPMPFWTCDCAESQPIDSGLYNFSQPRLHQVASNRPFLNEYYTPQISGNEYYLNPKIADHAENLSISSKEGASKDKYDFKSETTTKDVHPTSDLGCQIRMNGE